MMSNSRLNTPGPMRMTGTGIFRGLGPDAEYRRRLGEGVFEIQRCGDCARFYFYPRVTCRYCGSSDVHWTQPSGRATVYSTTVVRRRAEKGGDYNVAIVRLQEGPLMMSRIDDLPPEAVEIGLAVTPRVVGAGLDAVLVFVPAEEGNHHG